MFPPFIHKILKPLTRIAYQTSVDFPFSNAVKDKSDGFVLESVLT